MAKKYVSIGCLNSFLDPSENGLYRFLKHVLLHSLTYVIEQNGKIIFAYSPNFEQKNHLWNEEIKEYPSFADAEKNLSILQHPYNSNYIRYKILIEYDDETKIVTALFDRHFSGHEDNPPLNDTFIKVELDCLYLYDPILKNKRVYSSVDVDKIMLFDTIATLFFQTISAFSPTNRYYLSRHFNAPTSLSVVWRIDFEKEARTKDKELSSFAKAKHLFSRESRRSKEPEFSSSTLIIINKSATKPKTYQGIEGDGINDNNNVNDGIAKKYVSIGLQYPNFINPLENQVFDFLLYVMQKIFTYKIEQDGKIVFEYNPQINPNHLFTQDIRNFDSLKEAGNNVIIASRDHNRQSCEYKILIEYEEKSKIVTAVFDPYFTENSKKNPNNPFFRVPFNNLYFHGILTNENNNNKNNNTQKEIDYQNIDQPMLFGSIATLFIQTIVKIESLSSDGLARHFIKPENLYNISQEPPKKAIESSRSAVLPFFQEKKSNFGNEGDTNKDSNNDKDKSHGSQTHP